MKIIILAAFSLFGVACNCSKKTNTTTSPDTSTTRTTTTTSSTSKPEPESTSKSTSEVVPQCVQDMIKKYQNEPVQNPPRKIYSYTYQGKTVYFTPGPCCDQFDELYDDNCKLMGYPSGGITGRGDGKYPDFYDKRSNEKIIWQDKRK